MINIAQTIANEIGVKMTQVDAATKLLDEGATVPFISRYRKEVTGGLSDTDLRQLEERLNYFRELESRRATILKSIADQDKLTPELKTKINGLMTKNELEDIYLPFKPKRRTKAQIAKEAGLEPLATKLWKEPSTNAEEEAQQYIDAEKGVADVKAALDGAQHILMESFAENPELNGKLRDYLWQNGTVKSTVAKGKEVEGSKFSDYFDYEEALCKIPSHRALALFRGRKESILSLNLEFIDPAHIEYCETAIAQLFEINMAASAWLTKTVQWTWKIKLHTKLELELMSRLREEAELEAINVFKDNLKNLLMAAPAGSKATMALDPGFRSGVKVAVVDETGKLLEFATIFPHEPRKDWDRSIMILKALCMKHNVQLVSIGNGTASRETERLVADLIKANEALDLTKIVVSEAGASVYSASETAAKEFPELDVVYRGAVSIGRRLQDPLAELVKIDPKSIGVGQYQHDVNQVRLSRSLDDVIEDCVNAVGADLNLASAYLLAKISGLNATTAANIVSYREQNGRFNSREDLLKVPRMGAKTYEQAVGFLRITEGTNALDASAVHPESYSVVNQILEKLGKSIDQVMGNADLLNGIKAQEFTNESIGLMTIKDIINELLKPSRDPRPEFKTATFQDGIEKLTDLQPDMQLEGVVTNVTNFGAFVDVGVHQDGLVHISQLSNTFVANPHDVVKVGQIVKVKVIEVDLQRKRVSLTMRLEGSQKPSRENKSNASHEKPRREKPAPQQTAMGNAFKELGLKG